MNDITKIQDFSSLTEHEKYNICGEAIVQKEIIERHFVVLAQKLYFIKTQQLYLSGWDSWDEYCMEFGMSQSNINKLIKIYEVFVIKYQFEPIELGMTKGWTVVAEALPAVNSQETAKTWLNKAKVLTLRDMRDEVKETRTGLKMNTCEHKNTYTIKVCEDCGFRERVYEV